MIDGGKAHLNLTAYHVGTECRVCRPCVCYVRLLCVSAVCYCVVGPSAPLPQVIKSKFTLQNLVETHEIWGSLETQQYREENDRMFECLDHLSELCLVRDSSTPEGYRADAEMQTMIMNLKVRPAHPLLTYPGPPVPPGWVQRSMAAVF